MLKGRRHTDKNGAEVCQSWQLNLYKVLWELLALVSVMLYTL